MLFLTGSMVATMKSHLHQILEEVSTNNEITFAPNFGGGKAPTMKSHLCQILDEVCTNNEITFVPNFG
jgi:hypothetical protein